MLDQLTYDRSETIAEALNDQAGLEMALIYYLDGLLSPEDERCVHALILAQGMCRNRALAKAGDIARDLPGGE